MLISKQNLHTVTFVLILKQTFISSNIFFSVNLETFLKRKMDSIEECAPAPKKRRYNSEGKSTMVHGKKRNVAAGKKK